MRIAHLSDLHFSHFTISPFQFFSKRWLGNLNLLFCRKKEFDLSRLRSLPELLQSLKVDLLLLSGDLTTTSHRGEFKKAQAFASSVEKLGIRTVALPGNHDQYTRGAYKKQRFYQFFPSDLKKDQVSLTPLPDNWFLIALDSAIATSLVSSSGLFSKKSEETLEKILAGLPLNASIVLVNHYPLFNCDGNRRGLIHADRLRSLLARHPSIKLYLHGHTHRHSFADLRPNGLPVILDSGSATHKKQGSWNLLDLKPGLCAVQPYEWKNGGWQKQEERRFTF